MKRLRNTRLPSNGLTRSEKIFEKLNRRYPHRLRIIAEGDSWFSYPREWIIAGGAGNVIDHLSKLRKYNILQCAKNGDEVVHMLSGESKIRLIKLLDKFHIDYLLFSGGGNDIVGKYDFDFFLKDGRNKKHWKNCLKELRINRRFQQISNSYFDLVEYVTDYSKNKKIKIISHTYDYAIPDPKGAEFMGGLLEIDDGRSWMYPYLVNKNIPVKFHTDISRYFIDSLSGVLNEVCKKTGDKFLVANTLNTLNPESDWTNEIHPTSKGFKKIALKILAVLQEDLKKSKCG